MKNRIRKLLLAMCAVTAAFALAACGGSGGKAPADDTAQAEDDAVAGDDAAAGDAAEEEAAEEEDSTVSGKYATIQEFIDSDLMQQQLKTQTDSLADTGLTVELTGEGNQLIYNFIIEDPDISAIMASDPSYLTDSLESQASTFSSVAKSLSAAIDVEDPVVVVRYTGSDGTVLASQEYPASAAEGAAADDTAADTAAE